MNTEFLIDIPVSERDEKYARQAAMAAFRELEIIEGHLSRYIESSDISRINNLKAGESVVVDPYTFDCLAIALDLYADTGGAFNIAFMSHPDRPLKRLFELNRDGLRVKSGSAGLRLDLGGIGKGFGLDCMADVLREWDIDSALLRSSYSTVLALDPPPAKKGWEAGFGVGETRKELQLARQALSGSGIEMQGEHIQDPRQNKAARGYRAWALTEKAAYADGLSTAFMVMDKAAIRQYLDTHAHASAWIQSGPEAAIEEI